MTQPSGWYDDPQDPSQLRYWDGVVWSSHITPKVSPTVEQSTIGMPYGVTPAAARPPSAGSYGAQGPPTAPGGFHPPGGGQGEGQPGDQWPPYGQDPGPLGQVQYGWQSHPPVPTTPDGVVLSGWWKRVLARILDTILIEIVTLPLTFAPLKRVFDILMDYFQRVMVAAEAGSSTMPVQPTTELMGPILQASLTVLVVYLVYEVTFLTMTGATLGKKAVGISVRLRDRPGPPPLVAVLKRTAVKEAGSLVGSVPVVGTFGSFFSLLDALWPLWDVKRQAIHDKVGATNVVVGPQPKRSTPHA
jgi:uncharacterized RDD family membrane protein YckC